VNRHTHLLLPACGEKVGMRAPLRWAQNRGSAPSPAALRASTSPRAAGRGAVGRRAFITLLGSAVTAWPCAARAQQGERMRRIAVIIPQAEDDPVSRARGTALVQELDKLGWDVGRNLAIDYGWGASEPEGAQNAVAKILNFHPDVILTNGVFAAKAAQRATRTVPIVFTGVSEPVAVGLVESLARPGGNATGFTNLEPSVGGKWVELLARIAPKVKRVGFLSSPGASPATEEFYRAAQSAVATLGLEIILVAVRETVEIETMVAKLAAVGDSGLIVPPDTFIAAHRQILIDAATHYRLPAISPFDFYAQDGGLLSYGPNGLDQFKRAADYVDRILRGAKPADLAVQQPVKFELVINLKTARALGLDVPPALLDIADELIE